MKLSTILIVTGIVIATIGVGIVLMDNARANDTHINNAQVDKGQVSGEDRFKPHLVDLDDATQRASLGKSRLPAVNPVMVFFAGIVMLVVGVYDARRTSSVEKNESPGSTK